MNREAGFRGKRADYQTWVYGYLDFNTFETEIMGRFESVEEYQIHTKNDDRFTVIPETIGEMVILNGKRFYEGDWVRCRKYIGGNQVEYCYEEGYIELVNGAFGLHRKQGYYRPFKDWLEDYEIELLGNIHDNPADF